MAYVLLMACLAAVLPAVTAVTAPSMPAAPASLSTPGQPNNAPPFQAIIPKPGTSPTPEPPVEVGGVSGAPCRTHDSGPASQSKCKECASGTRCKACMQGYQLMSSTGSCDGLCAPGYQWIARPGSAAVCVPCPDAHFSPGGDRSKAICTKCPGFASSNAQRTACVCNPGFGGDAANKLAGCKPCAPGTFKNSRSNTACTKCNPGFSSTSAANSCRICSAGSGGNAVDAGVGCTPCEQGLVKSAAGNGACVSCPAGRTTTAVGSSSCSVCAAGFGGNALDPKVGCSPCKEGSYKAAGGNSPCSACAKGFSSVAGSPSCNLCAAGYGGDAGTAISCLPCYPGTFKSISGNIECTSCAIGTSSGEGSVSCKSFLEYNQVYCQYQCGLWGMGPDAATGDGCGQQDADAWCKLRTNNGSSKAESFTTAIATHAPGVCCPSPIYTSEDCVEIGLTDYSGVVVRVREDILESHGAGEVLSSVVCK